MTQENFQPIIPGEMFTVEVTRTLVNDTPVKMHYEFGYTVAVRPTSNDFINRFAALVCTYGRRTAKFYAPLMGVDREALLATLTTLTGAGISECTDAFVQALSEALLRQTDWMVSRIAKLTGFGSISGFNRYFRRKYGCSPGEWRWK